MSPLHYVRQVATLKYITLADALTGLITAIMPDLANTITRPVGKIASLPKAGVHVNYAN